MNNQLNSTTIAFKFSGFGLIKMCLLSKKLFKRNLTQGTGQELQYVSICGREWGDELMETGQ